MTSRPSDVYDEQRPAEAVIAQLIEAGQTVATAESITGGLIAAALTDVPGASAAYAGGAVAYATDLKLKLLGVSPQTVEAHGVVSAQTAAEMAAGARAVAGATWGVATTGVAGPTEQEGKPVGLVYVAVAGPRPTSRAYELTGDRAAVRSAATESALRQLLSAISAEPLA